MSIEAKPEMRIDRLREINAELIAALEVIANAPSRGGLSKGERDGLEIAATFARVALEKVKGAA